MSIWRLRWAWRLRTSEPASRSSLSALQAGGGRESCHCSFYRPALSFMHEAVVNKIYLFSRWLRHDMRWIINAESRRRTKSGILFNKLIIFRRLTGREFVYFIICCKFGNNASNRAPYIWCPSPTEHRICDALCNSINKFGWHVQ